MAGAAVLTADAASFCISEHRCISIAPFVFGLMLALAVPGKADIATCARTIRALAPLDGTSASAKSR